MKRTQLTAKAMRRIFYRLRRKQQQGEAQQGLYLLDVIERSRSIASGVMR